MSTAPLLDTREQALAFHQAVYSRITWPAGAETVLRYGEGTRVDVVPTTDAEAFADAVVRNVSQKEVFATVTPRKAGAVIAGGFPTGTQDKIHAPQVIFVDADVAKPGYPPTIEEALSLAHTFAIAPHAITCSGRGLQLLFLLSTPLETVTQQLLIRRLDAAFKDHLELHDYKMDKGVTTNLTRPLRVPGSFNRKPFYIEETGGPLQAYLVESNADLELYTDEDIASACPEDRTSSERYADRSMPGTRMAFELPISRILEEAHGWTLDGSRWASNVAGSSTERSASHYTEPETGLETAVVWSRTTAEEYVVPTHVPCTSFDWLARTLCAGDYGLATRLASRAAEAGSFDEILELFKGKDEGVPYTTGELRDLARKASSSWPAGLDRRHSAALAFRGVAADVASARGYKSIESLQTLIGRWGGKTLGDSPKPTSGGGLKIGVHPVTPAKSTTYTVRPDHNATFSAEVKEKVVAIEAPGQGMAPMMDSDWEGNLLDCNPLTRPLLDTHEVPLIVVSAETAFSYGQIHADALLTAAHREEVQVAVVSTVFFDSTLLRAGTTYNSSRKDLLGGAWKGVSVRGRVIYLAGRQSWRRSRGLVALGTALAAKGADVRVLDFPHMEERFVTDASEPSVADHIAQTTGSAPLSALMENGLDLAAAAAESIGYDANDDTALAARVTAEFARMDTYKWHTIRKAWIRNEGSRWVICSDPIPEAVALLRRDGFKMPSLNLVKQFVRDFAANAAELEFDPLESPMQPDELNVLNGVINLRTGELRDRNVGEVFESVVRARWDKEAKAPRWEKFLEEIQPDPEMRAYLQMIFGAAAFGSASAEIFPFFVGGGSNGKSIIVRTIAELLGTLATSLDPSTLEGGMKEHQWASLFQARLASLSELDENTGISTSIMKQLSNMDVKSAAFKYGAKFDFIPTFSPILMTNHLPKFKEQDNGVWRRVSIVRFDVTIPPAKRDHNLLGKLAKENDGILQWLVEGSMAYAKAGRIVTPAVVQQATDGFKMSLDVLGQFFNSGLVHEDPSGRIKTSELNSLFAGWYNENFSDRTWSKVTFRSKLEEQRGIKTIKSGDTFYTGVSFGPSVEQVIADLGIPENAAGLTAAVPEERVEAEMGRRSRQVQKQLDEDTSW